MENVNTIKVDSADTDNVLGVLNTQTDRAWSDGDFVTMTLNGKPIEAISLERHVDANGEDAIILYRINLTTGE